MKKVKIISKALSLVMIFTLSIAAVLPVSAEENNNAVLDFSLTGTFDYDLSNEVLDLINAERMSSGKSELVMSQELIEDAMQERG